MCQFFFFHCFVSLFYLFSLFNLLLISIGKKTPLWTLPLNSKLKELIKDLKMVSRGTGLVLLKALSVVCLIGSIVCLAIFFGTANIGKKVMILLSSFSTCFLNALYEVLFLTRTISCSQLKHHRLQNMKEPNLT